MTVSVQQHAQAINRDPRLAQVNGNLPLEADPIIREDLLVADVEGVRIIAFPTGELQPDDHDRLIRWPSDAGIERAVIVPPPGINLDEVLAQRGTRLPHGYAWTGNPEQIDPLVEHLASLRVEQQRPGRHRLNERPKEAEPAAAAERQPQSRAEAAPPVRPRDPVEEARQREALDRAEASVRREMRGEGMPVGQAEPFDDPDLEGFRFFRTPQMIVVLTAMPEITSEQTEKLDAFLGRSASSASRSSSCRRASPARPLRSTRAPTPTSASSASP